MPEEEIKEEDFKPPSLPERVFRVKEKGVCFY